MAHKQQQNLDSTRNLLFTTKVNFNALHRFKIVIFEGFVKSVQNFDETFEPSCFVLWGYLSTAHDRARLMFGTRNHEILK